MMHVQNHRLTKTIAYLIVLISLVSIVYAPAPFTSDSDHDGVPNVFDNCKNTKSGVGVDAFGCSCEQKECIDDNNLCTSLCGGPEATCNIPNSNSCGEFVECLDDKCVRDMLYDYSPSGKGKCIDGFCVRKSCEPVIVEESKRCKKVTCGDAVCGADETCANCETDCGPCVEEEICGDKTCSENETCANCETDCGICPGYCGDAVCGADEDCSTCSDDCGTCEVTAKCGDEVCDSGENCVKCPADCGECPPACGDGECNGIETCKTCQEDCGDCPPECGDGECNGNENCKICPEDCGTCEVTAKCGDEVCDSGENCVKCPADCGECPPACGDGECNGIETCSSCSVDCGECPPECGDGECNGNENCKICSRDCGVCRAETECGDDICNGNENCKTCSRDCGECPSIELTQAYWSDTNVKNSTNVMLTVECNNCDNKQLEISIFEDDIVFDDKTPYSFTKYVVNGVAEVAWNAIWTDDGFEGDAEYYFKASIEDQNIQSWNLIVQSEKTTITPKAVVEEKSGTVNYIWANNQLIAKLAD